MGDEGALDLRRAHAVARHVDHIVDAPGDPVIAVRIAARAVAGEVLAREGGEIGLMNRAWSPKTVRIWPGQESAMTRLPSAAPSWTSPCGVDDLGHDAEERLGGRPGLELVAPGKRGDQDAAGLRLPPGVDDRAAAVADDPVIPFPRLRIDRLADRTEQTQRGAAGLLHRLLARAHQRADRGRRGVENIDLVLVDDFPEPAQIDG